MILKTTPDGYQLSDPSIAAFLFADILKYERSFPEMVRGTPLVSLIRKAIRLNRREINTSLKISLRLVCSGGMTLSDAQHCVATNWVECWEKYVEPEYGTASEARSR